MKLARTRHTGNLISLVPMIDVMLILLVFFMVTSTFLDLDMIPVVDREGETRATVPAGATDEAGTVLMVRIGADGQTHVRGQRLDPAVLRTHVEDLLQDNPLLSVVVLPSLQATTQSLVSTMDTLTSAGATRLRLIRLEARQ